jgi:hypothetical protein
MPHLRHSQATQEGHEIIQVPIRKAVLNLVFELAKHLFQARGPVVVKEIVALADAAQ